MLVWLGGRVVRTLELRSTQQVAVECNPGQVVNTYVPLSQGNVIWYQPMGGDTLRLGR